MWHLRATSLRVFIRWTRKTWPRLQDPSAFVPRYLPRSRLKHQPWITILPSTSLFTDLGVLTPSVASHELIQLTSNPFCLLKRNFALTFALVSGESRDGRGTIFLDFAFFIHFSCFGVVEPLSAR